MPTMPISRPCDRARIVKNDTPRNPPTCGMRLTTEYQTAATGASGTPSTRPTVSTYTPAMSATNRDPAKYVPTTA